MKSIVLALLCALAAAQPAGARPLRDRDGRHPAGAGVPITAQSDAIRINAVGEVISKPTPVIQKERNFDSRANQELLRQNQPKQTP